jgi:hypothetical protein
MRSRRFNGGYGGAGKRVRLIEALEPAIRRGLKVVGEGQTFLLDTVLQYSPRGRRIHRRLHHTTHSQSVPG